MTHEMKSLISRESLTLEPSAIDRVTGSDIRSTARKAVKNIEAILAGGATIEARRYKINNRELERYSIAELLQLLSFWRKELADEERKEKGASKLGPHIEFRI